MEINGPYDEGSLHDKQLELENVQRVIQLTKENIDTLNERFARFNPSPQIYLNEYQELTSKLHGFKLLEQNLTETIQLIQKRLEVRSVFAHHRLAANCECSFRWSREPNRLQLCRSRRSYAPTFPTSSEHQFKWWPACG